MEFLLLAIGGGAIALSRSKQVKQVDQMIAQGQRAAGGKSVFQMMNDSLKKKGTKWRLSRTKLVFRNGRRVQRKNGQSGSVKDSRS